MYKDYTVDANLIASTTFLAKNYPLLVLPFLDALGELINIEYKREVEHSSNKDETEFEALCLKFAQAISELADELGSDIIYVPLKMYYKIRQSYVSRPNETVNFLKPLMK
jgi:hypothetical protein